MLYQAVLMDADQTLLDFETAERNALCALIRHLGIEAEPAMSDYRRINGACWEAYERGIMTQAELRRERFEKFTELHAPARSAAETAEFYEKALSEQSVILKNADIAARGIAAKLPIAIVTNGVASIQRPRITASPIMQYVTELIISEEIGAQKPDPLMIHEALERLGVSDASRALMIGDSLTSDMPAARSAKVDFLWYNPRGLKAPDDAWITYEASDVMMFIDIATRD